MINMRTIAPTGGRPAASSPRGRLLTAAEIRDTIFNGAVSQWWVRRHVAPKTKIALGRSTVVWYESDVYTWIEERRGK